MAYNYGDLSRRLADRLGILQQSTLFLDKEIKVNVGFKETDIVLDVEQGKYGISFGDNFLYTNGLGSCCGLVVIQGNKSLLFHLDDYSNIENVIKTMKYHGFVDNSTVLICPGPDCKTHGKFRYHELGRRCNELGLNVQLHEFSLNGYIKVGGSLVEVGSIANDQLVVTYQFGTKKDFFK